MSEPVNGASEQNKRTASEQSERCIQTKDCQTKPLSESPGVVEAEDKYEGLTGGGRE